MEVTRRFLLSKGPDGSLDLFVASESEATFTRRIWHGKSGIAPNSKHLARIVEAARNISGIVRCAFLIEGPKNFASGAIVKVYANGILVFQGRRQRLPRALNHLKAEIDSILEAVPQPQALRMYQSD